jgi:hypothetical protein
MSKQNDNKSKGVSRRDSVKTTGMGALAAGLGSSVFNTGSAEATQAEAASRPAGGSVSAKPYNVMVILTDQEHYLPELMGKGHWPGGIGWLKWARPLRITRSVQRSAPRHGL